MSTHRPRRRLLVLAVASLLGILAGVASAASARQPLQFGAWTPGDPYGGNTARTDALEARIPRRVQIVNWYQNWGGGDWISSVQPHVIAAVTGSGRTPLLTWEPWDPSKDRVDQPAFRLSRIARGELDAYMGRFADGLRALGFTVYVRPMHEMNGNWYPWSGTVNGNSPALFVQAWRRMHDVFARRGATNVRWVWSPNASDVPNTRANRMESYYPGDRYVDVLAVDGYNWGSTKPEWGGWQTFSQIFRRPYERLKAIGPQPIWIAEVGCAPEGGSKSAWVRDMFARARRMRRLEAIVWFNENKERDWRAAPDAAVAAAFGPRRNRPRLRLMAKRRVRAGGRSFVRWRARNARRVSRWVVYLNGRRVGSVSRSKPRRLARRIKRAGTHRWRVEGRSARGYKVVAATRAFRAVRLR